MSAKKRGHNQAETPFDAQTVAAISRDIPGLLAKEGYFDIKSKTPEAKLENNLSRVDMFHHEPLQETVSHTQSEAQKRLVVPQPIPRGNRLHLLYTVAGFSLIILSIWIFNTRSTVSGLWSDTVTKHEIIDKGAADFNSLLETINNNDKIVREKLDTIDANSPIDPITQMTLEAAVKEAVQPKPTIK